MKDKLKKFLAVIFTSIIFLTGNKVLAQPNKIILGESKQLPEYLANVSFPTKITTDGKIVYCLDATKETAFNVEANLVGELDRGFAYIIENGYPNKKITGDNNKDYYITQAAIWWYLDDTTGTGNLGTKFKETAKDPNGIRPYVKELVKEAKIKKEEGYKKPTLKVTNNSELTISNDKKYYISNEIKVLTNNIEKYSVKAQKGIIITDKNGVEKNTFNYDDSFIVKVPIHLIKDTNNIIDVEIKADGIINKVYKYEPTNKKMQPVIPAILYPMNVEVKEILKLEVSSSKVSVVKLDKQTGKPLSGAFLAIEDAFGNRIATWTSTTKVHVIRNLQNGKYKLLELKAPDGYKKINKPIEFDITDTNKNIYIKLNNEPRESVVTITKIDKSKDLPLAGAILVLKNDKGEVIERFETTTAPHVIKGLKNGTYIVSEEKAPIGFQKVNDEIKFTIDDKNYSYQVDFYNYPIIEVPDTKSNKNLINTIIGLIIILSTVTVLYKYAK